MRNVAFTFKKDEELDSFAKSAKPFDTIEPEEENYRIKLSDGSIIHVDAILCLEHGYLIEACFIEEGCRKIHFVYADNLWSDIEFESLTVDDVEAYLVDLCNTNLATLTATDWKFYCADDCITAEFVARYTKFLDGEIDHFCVDGNYDFLIHGVIGESWFWIEKPYSVFRRDGELYVRAKEYGFDIYHLAAKTENDYQDYIDFARELCRLLPE